MSAAGVAAKPAICSCRRAHSPATTKRGRQQRAEEQPQAGPDQAGLDGILDEEDAAERQRHAADPDRPAGAEFFLEADDALGGSVAAGGGAACGLAAAGDRFGLRRRRQARRCRRRVQAAGSGAAGGAAGCCRAPRPALRRRRSSSAARRASSARSRSLMLIVLTSATMAMIGNASTSKPSRRKKRLH